MKRILVIGAGDYQVPLIKRIVEMGYEAYCVDRQSDAPGFAYATGYCVVDALDQAACLEYAKSLDIQGIMTYGATITLPTVSYIGNALGLPTISANTAEIAKNKYTIKQSLSNAGCNTKGNFFKMSEQQERAKFSFEFPCVIKPCDGSGSKGVSVVNSALELDAALTYAFSAARYGEIYAESYIPGQEYSVEAFVGNDRAYVYAIVKTTFKEENGEISYGHRTPAGINSDLELLITAEVQKAVKALNITMGSVNFDVIVSDDDGKPYIIDCGIRVGQNLIGSHMVPLSRGVSVIDCAIALALGQFADAEPKYQKCIATRLLIYRPGVLVEIKPWDDLIGTQGIVDVVLRKRVGERLNVYREKSDTCGWVITTGETPDEAEQNAAKAKELLKEYIILQPEGE